jgi:hypothetical protein
VPVTTGADTTGPASDRIYRLPAAMCAAVDYTPLVSRWPAADKPLSDAPGECATSRQSVTRTTWVGVGVSAIIEPGSTEAKEIIDATRRLRAGTHDLLDVGTDAIWYGNSLGVTVEAYDGNLLFTVYLTYKNELTDNMLADFVQLASRVANGTFAKLPHD